MKIVVTGSAGVVGRAVRRALSGDHELVLLDRWPQKPDVGVSVQADLTDWRSVRSSLEPHAPFEGVVHLAFARTYDELTPEDNSALQLDVTVRGTWVVLSEAERLGATRCVFASSLSVYGHIDLSEPIDETVDPFSFDHADDYGLAKLLAESVVRHFVVRRGMRGIVLRLAAVHEPGVMERRGTHVDDVAAAFRLAVESDLEGFEVFNLAPDNPGWAVSNQKAKSMLGWRPSHIFEHRPDLASWDQPPQPPPDATGPPLGAIGGEAGEFVDVGDARLWTVTTGTGPPLVLLHGGPGGHDQLGSLSRVVEDLVTVHRFDQRACGRSSGDPPFTLERWVEDLEALRRAWGHDRWIVAGHSFGSLVALAYAVAHPERTTGLIWISCIVTAGPIQGAREAFVENRVQRFTAGLSARADDLRRMRDREPERWTQEFARELVRIGLSVEFGDPASLDKFQRDLLDDIPQNDEVNSLLAADVDRWLSEPGTTLKLSQVGVPALIVHGERDLRPMWAVEQLADLIPGAQLLKLPGGHFPWLEAAEPFATGVRAFIASAVGA